MPKDYLIGQNLLYMQEIKNLAQNDYLFNIYNIFVTLLLVQSKIGIFLQICGRNGILNS